MTQERFEQIRDTFTMEQYTMLSQDEYSEFTQMATAQDVDVFLRRWGHLGKHDKNLLTDADIRTLKSQGKAIRRNTRPLRTIVGESDNGRED